MFSANSSSALAEPAFESRGSEVMQERDDYMKKAVKESLLYALESNDEIKESTACSAGSPSEDTKSSDNQTNGITEVLSLERIIPPAVEFGFGKRKSQPVRTFSPISEWEGFVESIGQGEFYVSMVNVQSKSPLPTDLAVFSEDDVSEHDRLLLRVGAIVRWVIGRERLPSGQIRNVSELYFRRLPAHTKADYARALGRAHAVLEGVNWDDSQAG